MDDLHLSPFMLWLLRASWQSSIIILLVLGVQRIFRRHLTPRWRYRLWLLVLLRLVLPVSPASSFSIFNYLNPRVAASFVQTSTSNKPAAVSQVENGARPPIPPVAKPVANGPVASVSAEKEKAASSPDPKPLKRVPAQVAVDPDLGRPEASSLQMLLMGLADYSFATQFMMLLLLVVWPTGVVIFVLKILRQNLGFALRVMRAAPMTDPVVLDALDDCKRLLDIDFPILLVENKDIKSPALYGFFRPRLLLPEGLAASFSVAELKYIFMHELAHVKRLDMAANWLMTVLQILHWFNPVIWMGFGRIRADRELACDALVLSRVRETESESYGQTVIKLLESFILPPKVSGLVGLLEEKHEMKQRITMIARFKRASQLPLLAGSLVLLLGLVSLTDARVPEPKMSGPAGWWRAEGNARDSAGANNGVIEGAVSFAPGRGFIFNGFDADVKIPASASLDVGKGTGFTVAAWIDPEKVDIGLPIIEWNSGLVGLGLWVIADFGPGGLYAEMTDDHFHPHVVVSAAGVLRPHALQHVAFTYDQHKGMGALYVNGEVIALTFVGRFASLTDGDVYLGLHPYGEDAGARFAGQIGEVQVFSSLFTASEIRKLCDAGENGKVSLSRLETR